MIIVAPTSFKGTHSAADVARVMAEAAREFDPDILELPVSDGGPGLLDALHRAGCGALRLGTVSGPLGEQVSARILIQDQTAIVESADACGLHLVPEAKRNPFMTTSFGVGQLILAAARYASDIVVGLGGSATVDMGIGMARGLGWEFEIDEKLQFGQLAISRILRTALPATPITALADVRNPLYGPDGAARVFGPQKGASPEDVALLDEGLAHAAGVIGVDNFAGAGAAGGLAAGLRIFANAEIVSGSDWVLERIGFDAHLKHASLVITGEGSYDAQSAMGKVTGEIVARAERRGIAVLIVSGENGSSTLTLTGIKQRVRDALPGLLAT